MYSLIYSFRSDTHNQVLFSRVQRFRSSAWWSPLRRQSLSTQKTEAGCTSETLASAKPGGQSSNKGEGHIKFVQIMLLLCRDFIIIIIIIIITASSHSISLITKETSMEVQVGTFSNSWHSEQSTCHAKLKTDTPVAASCQSTFSVCCQTILFSRKHTLCRHQHIQQFTTECASLLNDKAQFKAALRKYANTHCFYCVAEMFMCKDDLWYCFVKGLQYFVL